MKYNRIFNFSAGPGQLPETVLEQARDEMMNYHKTGMSVMEMSHRSKDFLAIFEAAKEGLRKAMCVPDTHEILFLQGGATAQFAMAPLNLLNSQNPHADYAVTGNFADIAAKEAKKYGVVSTSYNGGPDYTHIPVQSELTLDPTADYFYYCANNTIFGTEWHYVPETGSVPLVCDMSSDILTQTVDVSRYGLIFAGAQKNLAPAGLTLAIIRRDLAGHAMPITPKIMDYQIMIDKDSMLNTPPCWCIYMLGLMLRWVEEQGGVQALQKRREQKAAMLYEAIDSSRLFTAPADAFSRSCMNVAFRTESTELDAKFLAGAEERGMKNLKGHRLTGHMRASVYNAMPIEGVQALCDYIRDFDKEN